MEEEANLRLHVKNWRIRTFQWSPSGVQLRRLSSRGTSHEFSSKWSEIPIHFNGISSNSWAHRRLDHIIAMKLLDLINAWQKARQDWGMAFAKRFGRMQFSSRRNLRSGWLRMPIRWVVLFFMISTRYTYIADVCAHAVIRGQISPLGHAVGVCESNELAS